MSVARRLDAGQRGPDRHRGPQDRAASLRSLPETVVEVAPAEVRGIRGRYAMPSACYINVRVPAIILQAHIQT